MLISQLVDYWMSQSDAHLDQSKVAKVHAKLGIYFSFDLTKKGNFTHHFKK